MNTCTDIMPLSPCFSSDILKYDNQNLKKEANIINKIKDTAHYFFRGVKNICSRKVTRLQHTYAKCSTFVSLKCKKIFNVIKRVIEYFKKSPALRAVAIRILIFMLFYIIGIVRG